MREILVLVALLGLDGAPPGFSSCKTLKSRGRTRRVSHVAGLGLTVSNQDGYYLA